MFSLIWLSSEFLKSLYSHGGLFLGIIFKATKQWKSCWEHSEVYYSQKEISSESRKINGGACKVYKWLNYSTFFLTKDHRPSTDCSLLICALLIDYLHKFLYQENLTACSFMILLLLGGAVLVSHCCCIKKHWLSLFLGQNTKAPLSSR